MTVVADPICSTRVMRGKSFVVLFRHGQRAPGKFLQLPGSTGQASSPAELWMSKVFDFQSMTPPDAQYQHYAENVCHRFPIHSQANQCAPLDLPHFPFGALTRLGVDHMRSQGEAFAHHHTEAFAALQENSDTAVFSTNYRRTQLSAQFLLDGLCAESVPARGILPVNVRDHEHCSLTFYENKRIAHLVQPLVRSVQQSRSFREREEQLHEAKQSMLALIPSLTHGTYGFDWPTAFDYFTCLRAHQLPIHPLLEEFESLVLQHFAFRYWSYFRDAAHVSNFVQPLLHDILHALQSSGSRQRLTFFSAHDITLFALLQVLGAVRVTPGPLHDAFDKNNLYSYWPHYGSVLVLEVDHNPRSPQDSILRVHFNFQPEAVDMECYRDWMTRTDSHSHSLERVLANNREALARRMDKVSSEWTVGHLQSLSDSLKQFVHADR